MSGATFGTDGWRGIIARDFTFDRVAEVTGAILCYLQEQKLAERGVVVGYDRRFQSRAFAEEVARAAVSCGIDVWLADRFLPSPAVSWAVREKRAGAGIIVTASHNPPQYSGLKLKEHFGGSARPQVTSRIEKILRQRQVPRQSERPGTLTPFNGLTGYLSQLQQFADLQALRKAACTIAVDVMYGAAADVLAPLLTADGFTVHELHCEDNPTFGGHAPNPVEEHLGAMHTLIKKGTATIGLATDGDGDRLAAIDERGRYLGPQVLFPLILQHLVINRGARGQVVKSASTTRMIDRICAANDLSLKETAIGFKHACQSILDDQVLVAGEESGAPGIPAHLPDRDGQLASLLLLEAIGRQGGSLSALHDHILQTYGPLHYRQDSLPLTGFPAGDLPQLLEDLSPRALCSQPILETCRIDGIKWILPDDGWLLIRSSGTEPVVRLYAESPDPQLAEALLDHGRSLLGLQN